MSSATQPTMATPQQPPKIDDLPVTLKVHYDGSTRRHKLTLRDTGAATLVPKVRELLKIAPEVDITVERYSDSAGAYVALDSMDVAVYKQLYRAAKAKQKLKLRVTERTTPLEPQQQEHEDKEAQQTSTPSQPTSQPQDSGPKPATVEDLPELRELLQLRPAVPSAVSSPPKSTQAPALQEEDRPSEANPYPQPIRGVEFLPKDLAYISINGEVKQYASSFHYWPRPEPFVAPPGRTGRPLNFAVCCNSCDKTMPGEHWHCGTCDDGDFDLCQACVDRGITCHDSQHWHIKRTIVNGSIVSSRTHILPAKPLDKKKKTEEESQDTEKQENTEKKETNKPDVKAMPALKPVITPGYFRSTPAHRPLSPPAPLNIRTCNCCVQEQPESRFVHCTTCEDFDLCYTCFARDGHGHNPKHPFVPVDEGAYLPSHIKVRLAPGRNQMHNAICDGCDNHIIGVRHKCLDCPDWDYCGECVLNAKFVHAGHRFAPIYDPLAGEAASASISHNTHVGIFCDGPMCSSKGYIRGVRYKCAICHDTDFCANCEASPSLAHNKTHPLVKFQTPVRHCTVATVAERDGQRASQMGDRAAGQSSQPRSMDTTSIASVQTVVDMEPVEPAPVKEEGAEKLPEPQEAAEPVHDEEQSVPVDPKEPTEKDLAAVFVSDTVWDGSILPPNHVFEQTWTLRNEGDVAWPAGCSVKFVGGDYMGHVSSAQPAGISELVSTSESTICYKPVPPGQEFTFTVLLRTPAREGKVISYWRLTAADGMRFGHRLWCDIIVEAPAPAVVEKLKAAPADPVPEPAATPDVKDEPQEASQGAAEEAEEEKKSPAQGSQMVFPKLEKESPMSSIHHDARSEATSTRVASEEVEDDDDFEDCSYAAEWDGSDDGFMTDEEYDILDASDEEYLEEQQKRLLK